MKTKTLSMIGILIALSFVGSLLKIPSPLGTIGFDSAAGFFAVLYLGYWEGAFVTAVGYTLIAASGSFPLGPLTAIVALEMAGVSMAFRCFHSINPILGIAIGTILNGVIAPLIVLPVGGWGLYTGLLAPLSVASMINLIVASTAFVSVKKFIRKT